MTEKSNGTLRTIISVFAPLAVLIGAAIGYGVLKTEVNYNTTSLCEARTRLDANIVDDHKRDLELGDLKKDLGYLRKAADDQAIDLKNQRILIEEILTRVTR